MKIFEIYNQLLESENYGYFKDRAGIHDYDAVLFGKQDELPKKYADWYGEIKFMTKEEYFRECARLQNTSYNDQFKYVVPDKVKKIMENMSKGVKYDMPYLNYVDSSQEGRHRVMAASELGQDKIPILILDKEEVEEPIKDKLSDMVGIWDDLVKDGEFYYFKASGTGWDVLDKILSCITRGYDTYYLDYLISLKSYPSLYPNNELSIIERDIKWIDTWINPNYINYRGNMEVSDEVLKLCVVLRCLRNNSSVIYSILNKGNDWYLPIPSNIRGDFERYDTCFDMLRHIGSEYYIDDYGLLPSDEDNSLYDIKDKDINEILGVLKKSNNKI